MITQQSIFLHIKVHGRMKQILMRPKTLHYGRALWHAYLTRCAHNFFSKSYSKVLFYNT